MAQNSVAPMRNDNFLPQFTQAETVHLETGVVNLKTGQVVVRMIEGVGWITRDNDDIVVYPDEQVILAKSAYPILISALRRAQPIVFEVKQA